MTKILPQEAAVIYAARHFITECGEVAIKELPEQTRYAFAALEATCKAYDETLTEPSECVDEGDDEPGEITFDWSDLSGLEPGIHRVHIGEGEFLPSGRVRIKVTLLQPDADNVVQLEPKEPAPVLTELDQAFVADMWRLVKTTEVAASNTALHMYRLGGSGRPIDTRITTHGISRLCEILDRFQP